MAISISFPPVPEGERFNLDTLLQWIADNAIFSTDGDADPGDFSGQIGGSEPDPSSGIKLWFAANAIKYLQNGSYSAISDVPVGSILMYPSVSVLPDNYLWCEGQKIAKDDFPALFAVLGPTYKKNGDTDYPTNFRIPDFTGRHPVGAQRVLDSDLGAAEGQGTYNLPGYDGGESIGGAEIGDVSALKLREKRLGTYYGSGSPFNDQPYPGSPKKKPLASLITPGVDVNGTKVGRLREPRTSSSASVNTTYFEAPQTPVKFIIRCK